VSAPEHAWSRREPLATYRLQLRPDFGFERAAELAPYLHRLGVTHAYLSPVLQAAPDSTHGYDVVDHSRASDALGGERQFLAMVEAFHAEQVGVVLDVVPNHMAAALPHNRWWWDVLENGPASFWAAFFDIDWDPPETSLRNRVLLPVLASRYGRALQAADLRLDFDGRGFTVRYVDHVFPVSPRSLDSVLTDAARRTGSPELEFLAAALGGLPPSSATDRDSQRRRHRDKGVLLDLVANLCSADPGISQAVSDAVAAVNADPDALDSLLERQNYRLSYWRSGVEQLDYRRFFDIDTLVALRVEDPEVFAETHDHILEWVRQGLVDGLRIDHVDGLANPQRYLERLAEATGGAWVAVEKVLSPGEELPASWAAAGTTGYDFCNLVTRLFIAPAGHDPLTHALAVMTGDVTDPVAVARDGKAQILDTSLAADLNRVVERVVRLTEQTAALRDVTRPEVGAALRGMIVAFPTYRAYSAGTTVRAADRKRVEEAAAEVARRTPDVDEDLLGFLVDLLTGGGRPELARLDAVRRFEQLTGPVMAKGVEDTAFYRYHRLVAANEVGADLSQWAVTPAEWHAHWLDPEVSRGGSLLASSTHDTKRAEDVRARLVLLSEIPERWVDAVRGWRKFTDRHRVDGQGGATWPDRSVEYLLFQTFFGAWPLSAERAVAYALKAAREAKLHTSWTDRNVAYEEALEAWVRRSLGDPEFVSALGGFVGQLLGPGRVVGLAQTLCKLTCPGIPDLYQGTELWDLSLVDPDNRRPVDFDLRRRLLEEIAAGRVGAAEALARADEGLPKLLVVTRALELRARRPGCFGPTAGYTPLATAGPAAEQVVAFGRLAATGAAGARAPGAGSAPDVVTVVPRLVLGLSAGGGWDGTTVDLPVGRWQDRLSGAVSNSDGGGAAVEQLLAAFPVALLERLPDGS